MKFMNVIKNFKSRQDYVDYRNQMLDEATQFLDDGKMDEYKAKLEDVETLDDEYTQYTEAKANVESMKGAEYIHRQEVLLKCQMYSVMRLMQVLKMELWLLWVILSKKILQTVSNIVLPL